MIERGGRRYTEKYKGIELIGKMRSILRVLTKHAKSDPAREGLATLYSMDDRALYTIYRQLFLLSLDKAKIMAQIFALVRAPESADVLGALSAFEDACERVVLEEEEKPDEFDWPNSDPISEVREMDGLIRYLKQSLLQLHEETKGSPVLIRVKEINMLSQTIGTLIDRRSAIKIKVGDRDEPEQKIIFAMDKAFEKMVADIGADSMSVLKEATMDFLGELRGARDGA